MEKIEKIIKENLEVNKTLVRQIDYIYLASGKISQAFSNQNKLLIFGNGGSAADSQHIAGELVGRFKLERHALPAIALTTDSSILTAWANDYDFKSIFERQIEALAKKDDILLGLSTSGNSENVIRAFKKGRELGTYNISLTGNNGGKLKDISDLNININSNNTPRIQEAHMLVYHTICELVEAEWRKYH